MTHLNLEK